ncbi:MAG TPA: hypothetical protein VM681_10855 [Candidatus Thermoplasmatota archaeon]|nr:hypothetical protein [Candidatus Thermoplasmatota archaeon]
MDGARLVVYLVGLGLVILAAWMLFFMTGLERWIPYTIAIVALVLIIGVAIMSAAGRIPPDDTRVVEERRYGPREPRP